MEPREHWGSEREFTSWLGDPDNVAQLGEALRIELEVKAIEVAVGPYSADILARDVATDSYVVIENQLGKTDHDHLGKALTYAATLGATAVVWVATNFTPEHRKAVDWLNDHTEEGVWFYGVSVELWRIDDSKPAVRFNVLTRPAEPAGSLARKAANGELTESRRLQLEWWTAMREQLLARRVVPSAQTAQARYWFDVSVGRSGCTISCTANTDDGRIGVRLDLRSAYNADAALPQLLESKDEIEREIGEPLQWNPHPENRDKIIAIYRPADLTRRDAWPEYIDWMVQRVARVRGTFAPRLRELDLTSGSSEE